ncbi:hypothetical protein LTR10_000612 [Elasticomyces elasticus]|nr:hypothetical protein LTR10_000612 [Elasticomyces elasticus]
MDSFMPCVELLCLEATGPKDFDQITPTFFVQQRLLESTSDYFVKALQNQQLGEKTAPGVLQFSEDKDGEWKLLLFWMYKHELPEEVYHQDLFPAVRAWALGDRLWIPEFQNHVMLVWSFRNEGPDFGLIKAAVQSAPINTPTRKLMAEEVVTDMGVSLSREELDELDGYNFLAHLIELQGVGTNDNWDRGLDDNGDIKDLEELNGLVEPDTEAKILRGTEFDEASSA